MAWSSLASEEQWMEKNLLSAFWIERISIKQKGGGCAIFSVDTDATLDAFVARRYGEEEAQQAASVHYGNMTGDRIGLSTQCAYGDTLTCRLGKVDWNLDKASF